MNASLRSASQVPKEKGIDISKQQLARCCFLSGARNIFKQPAQLQAAEVRAQWQSGLLPEAVLAALPGEARDIFRNSRVLPNNRIRNRLAGLALPKDGGLPLIGDADRRQIGSAYSALLEGVCNHFFRAAH